jgi:hypothetical protein
MLALSLVSLGLDWFWLRLLHHAIKLRGSNELQKNK